MGCVVARTASTIMIMMTVVVGVDLCLVTVLTIRDMIGMCEKVSVLSSE